MSNPTVPEPPRKQPEHDTAVGPDLPRRRWGLGLGASAVFTLASRPVLAVQCMSASSVASGNVSARVAPLNCTGLTPAQWVAIAQGTQPGDPNHPTQNGFPGGNPRFHSEVPFVSGGRADWGGNARLYEVMSGGLSPGAQARRGGFLGSPAAIPGENELLVAPNGANPISAEFAAALLNIRDGRIPDRVLTETGLVSMWNQWMSTGTFSPMAGATWDTDQIVQYLRTLQGA